MLCTNRCINQPPYLTLFHFISFCRCTHAHPLIHTSTHTHTQTTMLVTHPLLRGPISASSTCLLYILHYMLVSTHCLQYMPMSHSLHYISMSLLHAGATWSWLIVSIKSLCLIAYITCLCGPVSPLHVYLISSSTWSCPKAITTFLCLIPSPTRSCRMPFLHYKFRVGGVVVEFKSQLG